METTDNREDWRGGGTCRLFHEALHSLCKATHLISKARSCFVCLPNQIALLASVPGCRGLCTLGSALMRILESVLHAHLQTTSPATNRRDCCELLFAATHRAPGLWWRWWMTLATCSMRLPNGICIFTVRKGHRFCANRADDHALVLVLAPFGAVVGFILEMLGAVGLPTSIA